MSARLSLLVGMCILGCGRLGYQQHGVDAAADGSAADAGIGTDAFLEDGFGLDVAADGAATCTPLPEVCNGRDDDCDRLVDENFDLSSDPLNCGLCGRDCLGALCVESACNLVGDEWIGVTAGAFHSCAWNADGDVYCWGDNSLGQLGIGSVGVPRGRAPVVGIGNARAVSASRVHTCAVVADGSVWCWGRNGSGQLGVPSGGGMDTRPDPVQVETVRVAVRIATLERASCALQRAEVFCWGDNAFGNLGNGTLDPSAMPVSVGVGASVLGIAAGSFHVCALATDGVYCWGANAEGQLGVPGGRRTLPVLVPGTEDVLAVSAGGQRTCVTRTGGQVSCWGAGPRGDGSTDTGPGSGSPAPVDLDFGSSANQVVTGRSHTCIRTEVGSVLCFAGHGDLGQMGDGTWLPKGLPTEVVELASVTAISASAQDHTCAIGGGVLHCWGFNDRMQLGDGTTMDRNAPVHVE